MLTQSDIQAVAEWFVSQDTGISSETMASIALGAKKGRFDAPHDSNDFGRCYRLVKQVPAIRLAFTTIGEIVPTFSGILGEWDALIRIYERDLPSGWSDELCRRIKELRVTA